MIDVILPVLTVLSLLIASYSDIKSREIPDWLSYGLLFSALGIRLIFSTSSGWNIFWSGLLGFFALFFVGYVFYLVSQWGGGDAKLLMGMGAVVGIAIPWSASSLAILWYFLLVLFVGSIYGVVWIAVLALKSRKEVFPKLQDALREYHLFHLNMVFLTLLLVVLTFFNTLFWPLIIFPLLAFYTFILISVVEKHEFFRQVHPAKLTEGDWLAEDVGVNGRLVMEKRTLSKEDISQLRRLAAGNKLQKVLVKDGIPFAPSFLLAYILLLVMDVWSVSIREYLF